MKISNRLAQVLAASRRSHTHVAERVKLLFALSLERSRRAAGLSYSDLANRMETSPAYITKVFRGDSNLTIETMAKLAVATGTELDIRLAAVADVRVTWSLFDQHVAQKVTATSVATAVNGSAANRDIFTLMA